MNKCNSSEYKESTDFNVLQDYEGNYYIRDVPSFDITKKVSLSEEPNESLSLRVTYNQSDYYNDVPNLISRIKYNVYLTFDNNLHEVTEDYYYEIIFRALVTDGYSPKHVLCCSQKVQRTSSTISFTDRLFFTNVLNCNLGPRRRNYTFIKHFCCAVRRIRPLRYNLNVDIDEGIGQLLWESGHYSDIALIVDNKSFAVHKEILSSRSTVFKAMFSHKMLENQNGVVTISDFSADVIEELLYYMYTGKTKCLPKFARQLFEAAHKYDVENLQIKCEEFLLFNMSCENVLSIFDMASFYNLKDLKKSAITLIEDNESKLIADDSYVKYLERILRVDTITYALKICAEYPLKTADLKRKAFQFLKENNREVARCADVLNFFLSHPELMKQLYVFISKYKIEFSEPKAV